MEEKKAAQRLKEIREAFGWTREYLAEKLNVTPQVVANMEIGRKKIYADDLIVLSEIFGMTCNQFLGSEITFSRDLSIEQSNLLDVYDQLNQNGQKIVLRTAEDLLKLQQSQMVTLIPMLTESPVRMVELDYYPQAAGMGTGHVVENALPEKINVPAYNVPEDTDFVITVTGDSMEPTFYSGDKLYIRSTNHIHKGEIGVFNYQGEQMVKECGDGELISHNKAYEPIKINDDCYVQGVVLGKV